MKKVLIIANEFPPIGGSGVQRSSNLVKHLPQLGYVPIVVTKAYTHGLYDETLLKDIPSGVNVHRFKAFDFLNRTGILGKALRYLATRCFIPDSELFWYLKHRKRVLNIIDEQKIELVYSTSYPYSGHLMGRYLKKKRSHIKWVTDFRDEWTNNPYFTAQFYMKLRAPFEVKMEKDIVKRCDYMITNTPFMLANFLKDTPQKKDKATFIPNGYNEMDFKDYRVHNGENKKFTMTYMGALYGKRKPDYLLEAIKQLIEEGIFDEKNIELEFIGNYHQHIMEKLKKEYRLFDIMKVTPYMAHNALLSHMSYSNLLLLIESEKNFYTGKVFEYIRMGIPILATVPTDGAAADVVRTTNTGQVVPFECVDTIKQTLVMYYNTWEAKTCCYQPIEAEIEKFSWKSHASSIVKCFESA